MTTITLIAAMDRNRVIGLDGKLPWRLPDDLARFKALTTGNPIVMGRRTWESIGRPLPDRWNVVLSRDPTFRPAGRVDCVDSVQAAMRLLAPCPNVMVIGGSAVYDAFLPYADRMELTLVDAEVQGDAFFPPWDSAAWHVLASVRHSADARHAHARTDVSLGRA